VVRRHLEPVPRVRQSRAMAQVARIHAMIDISDGLSSEVNHICQESKVGARLLATQIPIHPGVEQVALRRGKLPLDYALGGREDFELLFALVPEDADRVRSHLLSRTGTPVSLIGEVVEAERGIVIVCKDGGETRMPALDYQHFLGQSGGNLG